jgi:hypothetical protein
VRFMTSAMISARVPNDWGTKSSPFHLPLLFYRWNVPASVAHGKRLNRWVRTAPLDSWRMSLISNWCAPS